MVLRGRAERMTFCDYFELPIYRTACAELRVHAGDSSFDDLCGRFSGLRGAMYVT